MPIENRYTCSQIKQTIERVRVYKTTLGDPFHPSEAMLKNYSISVEMTQQTLWSVWVDVRVGMDRSVSDVRIFDNEEDVRIFCENNLIGIELAGVDKPWPIDFMKFFSDGFDSPFPFYSAGGDPNFGIIYECLYSAGVIDKKTFRVSETVLTWAGPERIEWAKLMEPENWECIVAMDYCNIHFPRSSLAFMAAQFQFNYYIISDDYSAGYLMREIELILGGSVNLAEKLLIGRKNAGEAGRKASQNSKNMRLSNFMAEIEKLGDLVGRMKENSIVDQAFQNAVESDQALWKQGRGQQAEYETLLRSEPEYRERYYRVFRQTA